MEFMDQKELEQFIKNVMEDEILELKRRIHRVWDAQEEMAHNDLMLLNRIGDIRSQMNSEESGSKRDVSGKPELKENYLTLEESFAELKRIAPKAYPVWMELFEHGKECYTSDPMHNLSVAGHEQENAFHTLGKLFIRKPGYLLDIGCGPQAVPSYLRDFPTEYIYGMDPLEPFEDHPFIFTQNIAEFIPYKDESFDYITLATSLDHVLLLDKALDEIHRVLKKDGTLLIWAGTVKNAAEYHPYRENVQAVDEYHMFHIAPEWFEKMMENKWNKEGHYSERYGSQFYAFRKKGTEHETG